MLPFPVQFPSWQYWWTASFPSGSPAWGCFNSRTPHVCWLHLPRLWISTSSLPKPLREGRIIIILFVANMPDDCLSWAMGLSSETGTVQRCQHCSLAKMPPVPSTLSLSDAHNVGACRRVLVGVVSWGLRQSGARGCWGSIRHQSFILASRNQSSPSPAEVDAPLSQLHTD